MYNSVINLCVLFIVGGYVTLQKSRVSRRKFEKLKQWKQNISDEGLFSGSSEEDDYEDEDEDED